MKRPPSPNLYVPGLSDHESRVWQVLAEHPPLNVSDIGKKAQRHRPGVYACLASLTDKGLAKTVTQKRRTLYTFTGPQAMEHWRARQDATFAATLGALKEQHPSLSNHEDITAYEGAHVYRVWYDITKDLPKGSVFYRYDGYSPGELKNEKVPDTYRRAMTKMKLERFVITNAHLRTAAYQKRLECASRMLPKAVAPFEEGITQFVTSEVLAFVDFRNQRAYIIRNKALAMYNARVFQYLYSTLPE